MDEATKEKRQKHLLEKLFDAGEAARKQKALQSEDRVEKCNLEEDEPSLLKPNNTSSHTRTWNNQMATAPKGVR